jgi:hypothetical protein
LKQWSTLKQNLIANAIFRHLNASARIIWRVSFQRKKLLTLREHMSSLPVFFVGSVMLIVLLFVLSYYVSLRSLVTCCDVRYDFRIKIMFGSSLLPVVCRKVYLRYLCLIAHNDGPTQIVLCFCFCLVFPRLVVSFSGLSRYPLPLWNCLTLISRRCWNLPIDIYAFKPA